MFTYQHEGYVDQRKPEHVCKLHKVLYGLKQAPRVWYKQLNLALLSWGFIKSVLDTSLFIYKQGSTCTYLLVYVDEILVTENNPQLIAKAIHDLEKSFKLKSLGSVSFFLGFETCRDENGLSLTQKKVFVRSSTQDQYD